MENIKWIANRLPKSGDRGIETMSLDNVAKAMAFHQGFPQYRQTPLVSLGNLARQLGLGGIYVKDESHRFGLNAFKVLGGSYAMACYIADKLGKDVSQLGYAELTSGQLRQQLGQTVFYTATDGNHGRGVAWAAKQLGKKSVVYMPNGSSQTRLDNILKENARAAITDTNYDECVRRAAREAAEAENGVLIQDTAWPGYEDIPGHIMQGYGTMAAEAAKQLRGLDIQRPTHIFVQAGVGSLAAAVQGYFANLHPGDCPATIVVEANAADCIYQSAAAGDGKPRAVYGDMHTIMAGLNCGVPSTTAWEILRNHSAFFVSCPDWVSARGMRILAAPAKGDAQIISGESGAVSAGLLHALMTGEAHTGLKQALGLDESSHILMFSTEGDTDPEQYRRIVWEAAF